VRHPDAVAADPNRSSTGNLATGSGRMTWADDATTPGYLICTFVGFISEPIKLQ
jgi:hypothetical protein